MAQRAPLISALMALFSLQFADCLSPISSDHQSMRCCGSGSCNPTNRSHDCCKTVVVPNASMGIPIQHIALAAPIALVVDRVSMSQAPVIPDTLHFEYDAPQHSPPELYTLHSSLLI
jgi:hypothetical protein